MHRSTKVATCCYCGSRAALVLDSGRHELACASCGAPLHALKRLPAEKSAAPAKAEQGSRPRKADKPRKPVKAGSALRQSPFGAATSAWKAGKRRKKKAKKLFEALVDEIE